MTEQATINGGQESTRLFWNVREWIESNKTSFLPPVCNKMMHGAGQLKVFFVGGPNIRKDYHLEEGDELFYQVKGDMVLKVFECNKPKDVVIKEGEVFLLPSNVCHSPQRTADTVGLVIERERIRDREIDGIRYFVEENNKPSADPLYEAWFYCDDLGKQLDPVINGFFASEQCKTGRPIPGTVRDGKSPLPCPIDSSIVMQPPLNLKNWLLANDDEIVKKGKKSLFDQNKWQSRIYVHGPGNHADCKPNLEIFCLQLAGVTKITVGDDVYELKKDDCLLIQAGKPYNIHGNDDSSRCLVYFQDPNIKAATIEKSPLKPNYSNYDN